MTYNELLAMYQKTHPGAQVGTPAEQDAFNNWTGQIQQKTGATNWETIPSDAFTNQQYGLNPTPAVSTSATNGVPLDFNQLTGLTGGAPNLTGAVPSVTGGNYNMNEAGAQTGGYSSVGATNQTQEGQQGTNSTESSQQQGTQTNAQNTAQNQATTGTSIGSTTGFQNGTTAQQSTGTQASTGQTTGIQSGTQQTTGQTNVTTPFDIQSLVGGQLGDIASSDKSRNAYLTDFMNTGGTGFNSQVDQAVRGSLSGPGMQGVGQSGQARAAGYAGAQVARNNAQERLSAAQQLAGPTGLGTAVQTSAPLYGKSDTGTSTGQSVNTGTSSQVANTANNTVGQTAQTSGGTSNQSTAGNTATTGSSNAVSTSDLSSLINKASNSFDFQKLVGNEASAGTAAGSSASVGAGQVPESTPVKSGGCVVCTAYVSLGRMNPGAIRRAVRWKLRTSRYGVSVDGYMLYGPALARWVQKDGLFAKLFFPIARGILYHENYLSTPGRYKWKLLPCINHAVFNYLSYPVGLAARKLGLATGVRCPQTLALLKSQNLEFSL